MLIRSFVAIALLFPTTLVWAACQIPSNIVHNCGFDTDVTTNWTASTGSCSYDGTDGASQSGSASCSSTFNGISSQLTLAQCTPDAVNATYGLSFATRLVSGPSNVGCSMVANVYEDDSCTT